jgi:hypothetical protein
MPGVESEAVAASHQPDELLEKYNNKPSRKLETWHI